MFEAASNIEQSGAQWISDGCYAFMFESSKAFTVTSLDGSEFVADSALVNSGFVMSLFRTS